MGFAFVMPAAPNARNAVPLSTSKVFTSVHLSASSAVRNSPGVAINQRKSEMVFPRARLYRRPQIPKCELGHSSEEAVLASIV